MKTSRRLINLRCDETPCYLVSLSHKKGVPANYTATHRADQEKETNNHFKKATEFTAIILENRNAAAVAKTAHFPKMREVEKVGLLL